MFFTVWNVFCYAQSRRIHIIQDRSENDELNQNCACLAHHRKCELLPSLGVRHLSVVCKLFTIPLWNYKLKSNQTLLERYLEGLPQHFLILFLHQKKKSALKLLCQLEPNFTRMMFRRTSSKILISFWLDKKYGWYRHFCFWLAN